MHLFLCAVLCMGVGNRPDTSVDTGFRPSIDLPSVANVPGRGVAIRGKCNGFDEMSLVYFQARQADPKAPGLAAVTQQIKARAGGEKYLSGLMTLATQHSYSNSNPRGNLAYAGNDPTRFSEELVSTLRAGKVPKSVVFGSKEDGVSHRMTVYGADQVQGPNGPQWTFRVADSNFTDNPNIRPDDIRLVYVEAKRGQPAHWSQQVGGRVIARYDTGDMVRSPMLKPSLYLQLIEKGTQGVPLHKIRTDLSIPEVPPPGVGLGPGSVEVTKDPKAGGVMVRFDPALFSGSVSEAELALMEENLLGFLDDDKARVAVIRLTPRRFDLRLVALESLLESRDTSLTRIRGFVLDDKGALMVAGEREAGMPTIPLDVLLVALKAVYAQGALPFVSLDPQADTLHGPQKVRIGGLSGGLEKSQFALDMLDADYLMKRIMLGDVVPADTGFRSWVQIVADAKDESNSLQRMWLAPLTTPIGDLFEWREGSQLAVLFDTRVQIKSEQMRAELGQLVSGGGRDVTVEEAAGIMTRRFDVLCEEFPEFRRLRALFEASQLAAGLRAYGVRTEVLDALLKRTPGSVTIPATYAGIGPLPVAGTRNAVSGGVEVPASYASRTAVRTPALAPMLSAQNNVSVTIPKVLSADGAASFGVEVATRIARSKEAFASGGFGEAEDSARHALALEKDNAEARALLAASLAALNRNAEALALFDAMGDLSPKGHALKAMLHARAGDAAGVSRSTAAALAFMLVDDASLASIATARLLTLDLTGAKTAIDRLRAVSPTSPFVVPLAAQVADLGSRPLADRERRVRLLRQVPPAIAAALTQALRQATTPDRAIAELEDALFVLRSGEVQVPRELAVPYRIRLALLMGYAQKPTTGPEAAASKARCQTLHTQAVLDQPGSGLPHLMRAIVAEGRHEPDTEVLKWLKLAAAGKMDSDPVYPDIRRLLGGESLVPAMAMEMWTKRTTVKDPHYALLDFVLTRLAGRPETKFLKALRTTDGPAVLVDIRNGVNELSEADKRKALARFKRVEASIPRTMKGGEVGVLEAGRIYAYISILQLQLNIRAGADVNLGRGVNFMRSAQVGPSGRDRNATLIALMWVMSAGLATQDVVSNAPLKREMESLAVELRTLLDGSVPVATARSRLAALEKRLTAALGKMRALVSASLASSEKSIGPFSRAAEELSLAILQEFLSQNNSPFRDADDKHPTLAATPEYKSLKAASDRAGQSMFVAGNVEGKWKALLAQCVSGTDYLAAASLVTLTADLYQLPQVGMRRLLDRYAFEARLKAGG